MVTIAFSSSWSGQPLYFRTQPSSRRLQTLSRFAAPRRRPRGVALLRGCFLGDFDLPRFLRERGILPGSGSDAEAEEGFKGASEWLSMAAELGPMEPEERSEGEPEREYPDGVSPKKFESGDDADAWEAWQKVVAKESEAKEAGGDPGGGRDPREETDFWRSAARELAESQSPDSTAVDPTLTVDETVDRVVEKAQDTSAVEEAESADEEIDSPETPDGVWGAAREVTRQTSSLQEVLRRDLESFDNNSVQQSYRDAVKDVLPDSLKEPEDSEVGTKSNFDSEASIAEWNPDRDWQRFDDINREKALAEEKKRRDSFLEARSASGESGFQNSEDTENNEWTPEPENLLFTDDSGYQLTRAEVEAAAREGAVFVDEDGSEVPFSELLEAISPSEPDASEVTTPGQAMDSTAPPNNPATLADTESTDDFGNVPGIDTPITPAPRTLPEKPVSTSMYGSGWSGFDEAVEEAQNSGVPLRDSRADANFWRSAVSDVLSTPSGETDAESISTASVQDDDGSSAPASDNEQSVFENSNELELAEEEGGPVSTEGTLRDAVSSDVALSSFSEAEVRQPAQDVVAPESENFESLTSGSRDIWRSAASEVTQGIEFVEQDQDSDNAIGSPTHLSEAEGQRPDGDILSSGSDGFDEDVTTGSTDIGEGAETEVTKGIDFVEQEVASDTTGISPSHLSEADGQQPDEDNVPAGSEVFEKHITTGSRDIWQSAANEVTKGIEFVEQEPGPDNAVENPVNDEVSLTDEEQAAAWASWSSASEEWNRQLQTAPPRDPKQEVDMWRSSARELVPDSTSPGETPGTTGGTSDWGSGMDGKSERAAWESWNKVQGTHGETDPAQDTRQSLWWASREDTARSKFSEREVSESTNPEFWGDMARSLTHKETDAGRGSNDGASADRAGGRDMGEAVEFWRDIAKDLGRTEGEPETGPESPGSETEE